MATIESEAYFDSRLAAMGIAQNVRVEMLRRGWNTLANYAYCCAYVPGQGGSDQVFVDEVLTVLLGGGHAVDVNAPKLRRLYYESHT